MNEKVKKVCEAVLEITDEYEFTADEAIAILAAAAGGADYINDLLADDEDCYDEECSCECDEEEEDEEDDDPRVVFHLRTDAQGRVTLTKDMVDEIEYAQGKSAADGITLLKNELDETIRIGFGDWADENDYQTIADEGDGVFISEIKPRKQIQFRTMFGAGAECALEVYNDGEVMLVRE